MDVYIAKNVDFYIQNRENLQFFSDEYKYQRSTVSVISLHWFFRYGSISKTTNSLTVK